VASGDWFVIASGPDQGKWHMAGWLHSAIKTDDLSIAGGAVDRSGGWLALGICPRCYALVQTDDRRVFGDQQWAHEDWHAATDHPHPAGDQAGRVPGEARGGGWQ
jgi:hypothetical protein